MKFLSPSGCSAWLKSEGCCENPYGGTALSAASYLQFAIPKSDGRGSHTVDAIRTCVGSPRTCLFQVTDWSRYAELGNSILAELESTCSGDLRPFDAFGILFDPSEAEEMFACCVSAIDCGMSAYLYAPQSATFLLWEGDLVDVWISKPEQRNELAQWLGREQLRVTSLPPEQYPKSRAIAMTASKRNIPVWSIVAAGFAVFIGVGLLTAYISSRFPSPKEACISKCAAVGKRGVMEYVIREELTRGMHGKGPEECRCR